MSESKTYALFTPPAAAFPMFWIVDELNVVAVACGETGAGMLDIVGAAAPPPPPPGTCVRPIFLTAENPDANIVATDATF